MTTQSRIQTSAGRRVPSRRRLVFGLLGLFLATGCASTTVSDRQQDVVGELPRPARILVYNFAVAPTDLPAWARAHDVYFNAAAPMTADELDAGRQLGADVAKVLVEKINESGMVAVRAEDQPAAEINDIVLVGYFTSIDEGSAVKRLVIGFGKGAADIGAQVEGYRKTSSGMEELGSGDVDSQGGKSPGLIVPALVSVATHNPLGLIVMGAAKGVGEATGRSGAEGSADRIADEIAKVLTQRFKEQGWI